MRRWTDRTDHKAAEFFDSLPGREIRYRQDLCRAQIKIAHDKRLTDALHDLRRMEDALAASMLRRL